jgi:outer membrane biosynthesis protein TonB
VDLSALRPPDAGQPESPLAATVSTPAENIDPGVIYTSADEGINPPKMLYPQLPPPPLMISPSNDSVNVMEIIISAAGSVERVHLVSQPRRLTDMMLLSGAKSWRFAPASKNGLPVRYRMAFSWATTP